MLGIEPETVLTIADGVELKSIPETDNFYAFNTLTGDHFALNHTAFWVLNELNQATRFSKLESAYIETFRLGKVVGAKHLKEVVSYSLANSLVREVDHEKEERT